MGQLVTIAIVGIACWAFFGASQWLIVRIMGRPPKGQVYGSWTCFLAAFISAIAVIGLLIMWIWFTAESAKDQVVPWFTMVALFAGGGAWCLWSGWGVRARYDESGVEFVDWRGSWHRQSWSTLTARLSVWNTIILAPAQGSKLYVDPDAPGAGDLLIAAFEAGVPGTEKFVGRRSDLG